MLSIAGQRIGYCVTLRREAVNIICMQLLDFKLMFNILFHYYWFQKAISVLVAFCLYNGTCFLVPKIANLISNLSNLVIHLICKVAGFDRFHHNIVL